MTISTPLTKSERECARSGLRRAAFTLTEVMIGATLTGLILTGVLSALLSMGRGEFLASAYSELDTEARRGLEIFGADVRNAKDVHWNGVQSVTLTLVAGGTGPAFVTYAYDSNPGSATYRSFYRLIGDATSTLPRRALVREVGSDFAFHRYKIVQPGISQNESTSDLDTKQLQVTWRASRSRTNVAQATQSAVSASFILRNKRVTN